MELARVDIVVLDGVARALHARGLEPRDGLQERVLHVLGQRGRDAVRINRVVIEAFGLQKDLVTAALLEANDLVLDGRAIARADALDGTRIHGRAGEIGGDDGVGRSGRVGDVAGNLGRRDAIGEEGERHRRLIDGLHLKLVPVDGPAVEAWRRAGLEASHAKPEPVKARREAERRRLAHAARRDFRLADMDQAAQEGAGGEHHGAGHEALAVGGDDAGDVIAIGDEVLDRGFDHFEVRRGADRRLHGLAVKLAVGLGAGALDRRALALVEDAELDARLVGHAAHQTVQGVDLAHEMALAETADGGIAGHLADRGEAVGEERRPGAKARGRSAGLAAGMAAADDDDVESLARGAIHGR